MCETKNAARVMYCGHDGWFVADIIKVGSANVVIAPSPVSPDMLIRGHNAFARQHLGNRLTYTLTEVPRRH